ncbi:MAG: hypothetical protein Q8L60_08785 [Gammaproteobacteria bacterium]|nr:hypothetical protein [Gammaproteobacteria bacterium]MDP2140268.1 hypothetical protein [Gammaproteobacteria bacterium]MDP2348143.1 hypothetical protein [Gammaproteobacteria bacterium]
MIQTLSPDLQKAQQIAHAAQVCAIFALVGLVATIVSKGGFTLATTIFSDELDWRERVNQGGLILISLMPALLLFEAVNRLRGALKYYSAGEFFSTMASSRVAQAGDYGIQAMVAMILIVPNLTMWISEGGGGFDIALEPNTIGMLAFTLFVAAVGRILTAATQLKAENDAFV